MASRTNNLDANLYLNNFTGMNNLQDKHSVDNNELVNAENVDIGRDFKISTRDGFIKLVSGDECHSMYSDNKNIFYIDDDNLTKLDLNFTKTIIDIGYKSKKSQYIKHNNSIIVSNASFIKRYYSNKMYNMAPETHQNTFTLIKNNNGGFKGGLYKIACTFVFDNGIEGGTSNSFNFELNDNDGFVITDLQNTLDINVVKRRVYITEVNSTTLFHYGDFDLFQDITINYKNELGKPCETQFLDPIKNGEFITFLNGVIYTTLENRVYWSKPLTYLTDITNNYLEFESNINLCVAVTDGLYISTEDNIYFLSGKNPEVFTQNLIYNSPAIKYMFTKNITSNEVYIFTQMGQLICDNSGNVKNITEQKFTPEYIMTDGATFYRFKNGNKHIINAFNQSKNLETSVFKDEFIAVIERGGIII